MSHESVSNRRSLSPVFCHLFLGVREVFDYAGPGDHRCCLPTVRKGSALGCIFSELNRPARQYLCLRFAMLPAASFKSGGSSIFHSDPNGKEIEI